MAMVPLIQPPIMKLLTTEKERRIRMRILRPVSQREKIFFPIIVVSLIALLVPAVTPLMGMFMLGNFMRESGVVKRLSDTAQHDLMNIVTIFLGISVGATMQATAFLTAKPLLIFTFGLFAFVVCTAGGILTTKIMNCFLKEKINPLIGSAGVSAVPMAARVSQVMGRKEDPDNWLLMHAIGPNLAGVIGTASAAGMLIAMFAGQ
jgi:oxaloacetate decarboxylase beta subunit